MYSNVSRESYDADMLPASGPPLRVKLLFWLILGCFSTYLAEGVSGAGLFPFLHPWWILVCLPLYGLHLLVLAYVVYTYGRPRFPTLLLAGFIFGMYEAYMTKVVWRPDWGPSLLSVGGIATVETALISFFWHPVLAFLIPVVVGECVLTRSRESWDFLPVAIRRRFRDGRTGLIGLVSVAVACGAFQSFNSPSPMQSLLSGVASFGFIALLLFAWFRKTGLRRWTMRDLLPRKRGFLVMLAVLFGMYVFLGVTQRPGVIPGIGPQAVVWAIYAILFILLYASLRRSGGATARPGPVPLRFSWRAFLEASLALTLTSAGLNLVPGNHLNLIVFFFWVFGAVGMGLFLFSAWDTLRLMARRRFVAD